MTGETRIERDLLVAAAEVIREHRMGIHNIQCWKNSAVGCAGIAAGREDLVSDAIDNPDRGFRALALKLVDADAKVLAAMHGADYSRLMAELGKFVAGAR